MPTPTLLLAAFALSVAAPAFAQSQPTPPPPPGEHGARQPEPRSDIPEDPAEAKKQLEKRLEDFSKREERYREALKKIEQGVSPREAMKDLEPGRGRSDEARRPMERRGRDPVTKEEREHAIAFLRTNRPTLAAKLETVDKAHPEYADRGMNRLVPRLREAEDLFKSDPKQYELKMQEIEGQMVVIDAIRAFREASTAKPADQGLVNKATAALRNALAAQLDVRISLQVIEIADLNRRLDELKSDLDKKRANRDTTIDTMITKIRDFKERPEGKDKPESGDHPKPH